MTLFRRILLYYVLTLLGALGVVGYCSWVEFGNQLDRIRIGGLDAVSVNNAPLEEAIEVVLFAGVPAVLIGVIGGVVFVRRALRPIQVLTEALEKTDVSNLTDPVACSGNGDELDRMAAVFNRMKKRLDLSFTQSREFTLHASHELKTPLTVMHATLEQMLDGKDAAPSKERVTSMLEEVQRLSGIVGQLTFLARADAGLMESESEDLPLDELVRDLADETVILGSGGGISVKLTDCQPATVRGDRMRLRQLLLNLADNAVKYNQPGGTVEISLRLLEESAVCSITNTGPSLPSELAARVFDRFFRGDPSHNRNIEGSGLGLSIAKCIVEAHHGEISYEVLPDWRTRVSVSLPAFPAMDRSWPRKEDHTP